MRVYVCALCIFVFVCVVLYICVRGCVFWMCYLCKLVLHPLKIILSVCEKKVKWQNPPHIFSVEKKNIWFHIIDIIHNNLTKIPGNSIRWYMITIKSGFSCILPSMNFNLINFVDYIWCKLLRETQNTLIRLNWGKTSTNQLSVELRWIILKLVNDFVTWNLCTYSTTRLHCWLMQK